ncbi:MULTISPECIES: SRPBCC family protein [Micrococcus]|uniref:SRPBCC family protein n=1 Tax=Micrococcus antarcticus TaxID=86171 RepID=UPI002610611D|nr:SRPBCC family protein [uncultured Micrococcus sp.]
MPPHPARRRDRPFVFSHAWSVPLPAAEAMDLLGDPLRYPEWWPAIPAAWDVTDRTRGDVVPGGVGERAGIRLIGFVPVRLTMERVVDDRARGVLLARLKGDLEGTVRVEVHDDGVRPGTRCTVAWHQEVVLGTPWMRAVAAVPGARAAMRASHATAMRAGRRSLGAVSLPAG